MPTQATITLKEPHIHQREILKDRTRFRVVACGRRFGKTYLGTVAIINRSQRGARSWWLAPTYQMGQDVWREIKTILKPIKKFCYINNSERRMELPTGGVIEVKTTAAPDSLRGAGLDFVVLDEAAFMESGVWAEVVRPMLLTTKGSALFLSSPNGRNWFWRIFQLGDDPIETDWASYHFTSLDSPIVDEYELESIRRTTPQRTFEEEYLAEFKEDSGTVFRGVDAAVSVHGTQNPVLGQEYIFGVDWGKDNDYTVIAVIEQSTARVVAMDRFNHIGWHFQRARLVNLYNTWMPTAIHAEENSIGSPNIEALQREGLPVQSFLTTSKSKGPLIEGLALAIECGDIGLLDDPVLLNELKAYELERMPGGYYKYSAPHGSHDDTVIALALAWHGVTAPTERIVYDDSLRVRIGW